MDKIELYSEHEILEGNINRMFLTNDLKELYNMYAYAKFRLELIFNANYLRLKEEKEEMTE